MNLKNSTDWSNLFLRRMLSWCCKQVGVPVRQLHKAEFGNRTDCAYSGRGTWKRILVRIGPASCYPVKPHLYPGRTDEAFMSPLIEDRVEGLIAVTAHELTHAREHYRMKKQPAIRALRAWGSERQTMFEERRVLELFKQNREALLAEWSAEPSQRETQQRTLQEKRAEKVQKDLSRWTRKLKLAQTKIRKLKQRASYYERTLAAMRGSNNAT